MTAAQLLEHLLKSGAVYTSYSGTPLLVLVHAELVDTGLFLVALPAENQSHCHFVAADRAMAIDDRYVVLYGTSGDSEPIGQVAAATDTPEVNTDDVVADVAAWQHEVGSLPRWREFVAEQRAELVA